MAAQSITPAATPTPMPILAPSGIPLESVPPPGALVALTDGLAEGFGFSRLVFPLGALVALAEGMGDAVGLSKLMFTPSGLPALADDLDDEPLLSHMLVMKTARPGGDGLFLTHEYLR